MQEIASAMIALVGAANPKRKLGNLDRRLLKMHEEAGEMVQAFLHVSSKGNGKNKTWHDVREEGVDTLIPILDVILTPMPDQHDFADQVAEAITLFTTQRDYSYVATAFDEKTLLVEFFSAANRFVFAWADAYITDDPQMWWKFRIMGIEAFQRLLDMLLLPMPDQVGMSQVERETVLLDLMEQKLAKWQRNRVERKQTTEDDISEDDV